MFARSFFHGVRFAERLVPPALLVCLLWPFVAVVAFCRCLAKPFRPLRGTVAEAAGGSPGFVRTWRSFVGQVYARFLMLWPDRFIEPAWRKRFTVTGLEPVMAAHAAGRPVVLAVIHAHHMMVLRLFLRVRGLPVAWLRSKLKSVAGRDWSHAVADGPASLSGLPHEFSLGQLRSAYGFLRSGRCLLMACDVRTDDAITLPTVVGTMRINVGPFRFAALADAIVVPAVVWQDSPWRFTLAFGEPMTPPPYASKVSDFASLAAHALATWQAVLHEHPEQVYLCGGVWNVPVGREAVAEPN